MPRWTSLKLDSLHVPTMQHDKWSFSSLEDSVYGKTVSTLLWKTVSVFPSQLVYTSSPLILSLIPHAIQIFWYYICSAFSLPPSPWMYFTLPPSTKHHQSFSATGSFQHLSSYMHLWWLVLLVNVITLAMNCNPEIERGHICDPDVEAGRYRFLVQILRNSGQENIRPGQGGTHL